MYRHSTKTVVKEVVNLEVSTIVFEEVGGNLTGTSPILHTDKSGLTVISYRHTDRHPRLDRGSTSL